MEILLLCLAVGVLGLIAHSVAADARWSRMLRDQSMRHESERKEWLKVIRDLHNRIHAADIPSYMTLKQADSARSPSTPSSMTDEDEARLEAQRKPLFSRA